MMLARASDLVASLFGLLTLAAALPHESLEERATSPKCVTYKSGYLATSLVNGAWNPFSLHSGTLAYDGSSGVPVHAEFQTCTPNYAGSSNVLVEAGDPLFGRIYLPESTSCLAVDAATGAGISTSCLNSASGQMTTAASIPQNFAWRTFSQDTTHEVLFWTGAATANGTQGATSSCDSFYGYKHASGVLSPTVGSGNVTTYICDDPATNAGVFADLRSTPTGTST
ncbi:hypothetical protein DL93DRAFT_2090983 [Clavulina sp. PMI_390]|nr:hypothetical protein DL93DRAFT_2090983 [Clavulina sp. PMI_390]